MKHRIVAIMQARMGSSRLPGKMLEIIGNRTLLELALLPLHDSRQVSEICIATTTSYSDDQLCQVGERIGYPVFRGSENDLLARFIGAIDWLKLADEDILVRVCGDNLLTDTKSLDQAIDDFMTDSNVDLVTNAGPEGYPCGTIWEFSRVSLLRRLCGLPLNEYEREHIFMYVHSRPFEFRIYRIICPAFIREEHFRLTIDETEDLEFARKLSEKVENTQELTLNELIKLKRIFPSLFAINNSIKQKTLGDGIIGILETRKGYIEVK